MAHRAIVIGVNEYAEQASINLKGAVDDAINMTRWLIAKDGGAVPAGNVTLITNPAPTTIPPEIAGVRLVTPARAKAIFDELAEIPKKFAAPADRFYFYFAGHGLTAPSDIAEEAILPSDFSDGNTNAAIGVRSILEWLKTAQFNQQFIFVDACRDVPFARRFRIGGFPFIPEPSALRPHVEQFVYMSTSRGLTATEAELVAGSRAGVFTEALVLGLRGDGEAKVYNVAKRSYDVTSSRILEYLVARVREQIAALNLPAGSDSSKFLQTPTLSGERISDPVLVSIPRDQVPPVNLTVQVSPAVALAASRLTVERDDVVVVNIPPPLTAPHVVALPPKEYSIVAAAANFTSTPGSVPLNLYRDSNVAFTMEAAAQTEGAPSETVAILETTSAPPGGMQSTGPRRVPEGIPASVAIGDVLATWARDAAAARSAGLKAELTVTCSDASSPLEIEDAGNETASRERRIIATGNKSVTVTVDPGMYLARMRAPNSRSVEQLVNLAAGEAKTVVLEPPGTSGPAPFARLVEAVGFKPGADGNTLNVSESSGLTALAWVRLSTILSVAASAEIFSRDKLAATRLRSIGLSSLRATLPQGGGSALQVLFGDEFTAAEAERAMSAVVGADPHAPESRYIDSVRISHWAIDTEEPMSEEAPQTLEQFPFIGERSWALSPGSYWLAVRNAEFSRVLIAVTVLPGRVTNVILTRNERKKVAAFMYQPSPDGDPPQVMTAERTLEMAQRYLMSGQPEDAFSLLSSTGTATLDQRSDPVGVALAGYIALRSIEAGQEGRAGFFEGSVNGLRNFFPTLPDSNVLAAEFHIRREDRTSAAQCVLQALDSGIPVFDEGVTRLARLTKSLEVRHARSELLANVLEKRLRGMVWTIYTPR